MMHICIIFRPILMILLPAVVKYACLYMPLKWPTVVKVLILLLMF